MPGSGDIVKDITKPYYASDFKHALLSSCSYMNSNEGDILAFPSDKPKSKYNKHLKDWRVEKVFSPPKSDDYYSALYINDNDGHAVLAHRGTDIKNSLIGFNQSLKADMIEILNRNIGVQQIAAYAATAAAIKFLKEHAGDGNDPYHFSITGHSLGAWLAELSLYFCHMDFNYNNVKAVTFDSPGTADHLVNFKSNILNADTNFNPDLLDLTTYLSAPNPVNICNRHIGQVYRIYPEISNPASSINNFLNDSPKLSSIIPSIIKDNAHYAYCFLSYTAHNLNPMLDVFDETTTLPVKYKKVNDWPLLKHDNSGKISVCQVTVKTALKKLAPSWIPEVIVSAGAKAISALIPATTTSSVANVVVEFISCNIGLLQICDSFKHLALDSSEAGYIEKEIANSKELFHMHYKGHYRVIDANPYKLVLSTVKGSHHWCLKKISKYNLNGMQDTPEIVINMLNNLKRDYNLDVDQGKYIITSNIKPINTLKNQLNWLVSYDQNLVQKLTNLRAINIEKIFSNLPKKLPIFVGRQDVMQQIETILLKNSAVAISAFAGTGKSSTAIEYGHKVKEEGALVRFITAETADKLNSSYRELAKELAIDLNLCMDSKQNLNMQEVFRLVHQKSAVKADNVLFIFDNVEKYSNIEKPVLSLGNTPIKAIITTRDKNLLPEAESNIRLEPLCKDEAKDYITKTLGKRVSQNATEKLAEFLTSEDNLIIPHKLGKAVAFLQNNKFWSIEKYIEHLTNNPDEDEYILLFDQIAKSPIAWNILQYASFLDPDFIDIDILRGLKLGDDLELEDATKDLEKLSLASIEYRDEKPGIKIQRLLQEKVHDSFIIKKDVMSDKDELAANLVSKLSELMPMVERNPDEKWKQAEEIYPHVECLFQNCNISFKTKSTADLLAKIANYQCLVIYDFDAALNCGKKALKIYQNLGNDTTPNIANCLNNLGFVYWENGKYGEALKYHKKAVVIREKIYGRDHPDIATSFNNVGLAYRAKGEYDEALKYHRKSLAIREKIYKEDHPDIAMSLNNLGTVYLSKGQYDEALKYYKKSLAIRKKIYKEDHQYIASSLNNLGNVYHDKGQYDEALKCHNESLAISEKIYGRDHQYIASSLNNLGFVYQAQGKYDEALKCYNKSLAIKEKVYNGPHPCIDRSLNNLQMLFSKLKNKGGYKYKADSYLNMKKFISSPDNFLDKPIINLSSDAEDIELTSNIITKFPITLNRVAEEASKANWSSGFFISKATPILGDWGVQGFTSDSHIKNIMNMVGISSPENIKLFKLLCFEAICLGIASQSSGRKNYKCLDEFIKINPGIADIVLKQHPEYFVNTNLLKHCKDHIQDKKLLGEVLESANNRFKVSEMEVKNEDMEDEENIIITNDYDENNDASSTLFGEEFATE
ncbi:MAG TPA: tetratricopeptide repeat protein [Candidatus Megaira endosymbiont of Nemacystus decipiens]|nr:tetratricopeptide repeat protein [Candidatus Megaera endosymbiont of Nemacystus decipiens]